MNPQPETRGTFVEKSLAASASVSQAGLIRAHGEEGGKAMFAGKSGAVAREWLAGLPTGKFREKLCFRAGYRFTGPGLEEYLDSLAPPMAQDRFLTGYACSLAETDGFRAMKEFMKKKGNLAVADSCHPVGFRWTYSTNR